MKVLKASDPKLKEKMERCSQKNQSFSIVENDTIHIFRIKKEVK